MVLNWPKYLTCTISGINVVLFFLAVSILVYKDKARKRWRLLVATLAMFILATINMSLSLYMLFHILLPGKILPDLWGQIKLILCVYAK